MQSYLQGYLETCVSVIKSELEKSLCFTQEQGYSTA